MTAVQFNKFAIPDFCKMLDGFWTAIFDIIFIVQFFTASKTISFPHNFNLTDSRKKNKI